MQKMRKFKKVKQWNRPGFWRVFNRYWWFDRYFVVLTGFYIYYLFSPSIYPSLSIPPSSIFIYLNKTPKE